MTGTRDALRTAVRFSAFSYLLLAFWAEAANPPMIVTGLKPETVREFLGGKTGRLVCSNGFRQGIFTIDLSADRLTVEPVVATDTLIGYRSVELDPTGTYVTFCATNSDATYSDVYTVSVQGGTPVKIGSGDLPHWWVHPTTKKVYLLYQSGDDILSQELDDEKKPVGSATTLISGDGVKANGGRSASGRLFAADDNGHGMLEINAPWDAVANVTMKTHVYYAGSGAAKAYCNGHICPSAVEGSPWHGCLLQMGSGHTDVYVRKYFFEDPQSNAKEYIKHLTAPKDYPPEGDASHTHWHGTKWSWDENYAVGNGINCKACHGAGHLYIIDLAQEKLLRVAWFGAMFPHLWVSSEGVDVQRRGSVPDVSAAVRLSRNAAGDIVIQVAAPRKATARVIDMAGRSYKVRRDDSRGAWVVAGDALPSGFYVVEVQSDGARTTHSLVHAR